MQPGGRFVFRRDEIACVQAVREAHRVLLAVRVAKHDRGHGCAIPFRSVKGVKQMQDVEFSADLHCGHRRRMKPTLPGIGQTGQSDRGPCLE